MFNHHPKHQSLHQSSTRQHPSHQPFLGHNRLLHITLRIHHPKEKQTPTSTNLQITDQHPSHQTKPISQSTISQQNNTNVSKGLQCSTIVLFKVRQHTIPIVSPSSQNQRLHQPTFKPKTNIQVILNLPTTLHISKWRVDDGFTGGHKG